VIALALVLQQASATGADETVFDTMPTWALYGLLALLILGVLWFSVTLTDALRGQRARDRSVKAAALAAGMTYHETDPAGIGELRFVAFAHGKGTRLCNVVSGKPNGVTVRAFDFSTYVAYTTNSSRTESGFTDYFWGMDGGGETSSGRTTRRYSKTRSGAVAKVDAFLPPLLVAPTTVLSRAFEAVGAEDVDFESEEFNRRFDVRSADKRFASLFLDARMIDFMLDFGDGFAFETFGNYVMCHGKRCDARQLPALVEKMGQLVPLLNPLIRAEYPTVADIEYREAISEWNRRPGGTKGYY
jgi:hypothetical protein